MTDQGQAVLDAIGALRMALRAAGVDQPPRLTLASQGDYFRLHFALWGGVPKTMQGAGMMSIHEVEVDVEDR